MATRRTKVSWDPTLTRVEYLDWDGNPCFCVFEKNDDPLEVEARNPTVDAGKSPRLSWRRYAALALTAVLISLLVAVVLTTW